MVRRLHLTLLLLTCSLVVAATNATNAPIGGGGGGGGVTCLSESGDPVEYWVILKFPDGSNYAYADEHTSHLGMSVSPYKLESPTEGAVAHTLNTVYSAGSGSSSVGHVEYNDEWPDEHKHGTGGHTKGFVGFDEKSGFWLIHSVPRFPDFVKDGYSGLPEDEMRYGQSFMCISTSLGYLEDVAAQLLIGYPWVYSANVPEGNSAFANMQNMKSLANGDKHYKDMDSNVVSIKTHWGVEFTTFYKSPKWGKYIYEDMVEPHFDTEFAWETWMNGINPDPSFCEPKSQYNSTNIRNLAVGAYSWKETQDHSKWGVSIGWKHRSYDEYLCIGDINRQESQNKRGGGTTCIQDVDLWRAFYNAIKHVDCCCEDSQCDDVGFCKW